MNCTFCDKTVADNAERCPTCSAILRRSCPSCGKINPVHVETCFACNKLLPALPAAPEPKEDETPTTPKPSPTMGSIVLRGIGFLLILIAFIAAVDRQSLDTVLNCLLFSFLFFVLARVKETTDGTWEAVNRIESQLNNRARRR